MNLFQKNSTSIYREHRRKQLRKQRKEKELKEKIIKLQLRNEDQNEHDKSDHNLSLDLNSSKEEVAKKLPLYPSINLIQRKLSTKFGKSEEDSSSKFDVSSTY